MKHRARLVFLTLALGSCARQDAAPASGGRSDLVRYSCPDDGLVVLPATLNRGSDLHLFLEPTPDGDSTFTVEVFELEDPDRVLVSVAYEDGNTPGMTVGKNMQARIVDDRDSDEEGPSGIVHVAR